MSKRTHIGTLQGRFHHGTHDASGHLPGQRDAFLQEVAAAGILAKVQQEDGFERYDYYLSAADPDELLIVEEWDSEAQQQAHVNTDHMAQLRAIKEKYVASTAMQRIAKAD